MVLYSTLQKLGDFLGFLLWHSVLVYCVYSNVPMRISSHLLKLLIRIYLHAKHLSPHRWEPNTAGRRYYELYFHNPGAASSVVHLP